MINGVLPDDIRVLAYAEADENFNARYSCNNRTYKYFFLESGMDIQKIEVYLYFNLIYIYNIGS